MRTVLKTLSFPRSEADKPFMSANQPLRPDDPNQIRAISLNFSTDSQGEMTIGIGSDGFKDDNNLVLAYLLATIEHLLATEETT